ncbi:MAG: MBL fold metallo-hydrolase [Spirochaetales bacterium]|nr:MBL fold metallo-hydrolase [Spirochaetales bacterium]
MKINFFGAARTVTGTQHLLEINGYKILLDCGLYQGQRKKTYEVNKNLPYDAAAVDMLILSHAHIDHSGNIPNLVKNGFKGDIIATYATRDLCTILLKDSAKIQEHDIHYLNKKRVQNNLPPVEAIYTTEDALKSLKYFVAFGYERTREILPGVQLTLYDAGHILGSSFVVLDIEDHTTKKSRRLVFSGDLGRPKRPILKDPALLTQAHILLVESTYGDRVHERTEESVSKLKNIVNTTVKRGGKVIVPSFAVGRTQELVYSLHQLVQKNEIPKTLPVYVDSPLAIDATSIYRLHPEAYDEETEKFMLEDQHKDPFGFAMMRYTRSTEQSKELNKLKGPAVIISASGMAENGRILHHLMHAVEDSRNTILFVGWQAPYTLGRRILEKNPVIKIFGDEYKLKADVAKINGLSAHADKNEILSWLSDLDKKPEHTFVVHGEESVSLNFAETLRKHGFPSVEVPTLGQAFEI